ncbi:hypothetical protein Bbelb_424600 [Branchiostoma belcheri]|nr:hypothetical protein Bbelb_424600 [Branchiostoma belcheri]
MDGVRKADFPDWTVPLAAELSSQPHINPGLRGRRPTDGFRASTTRFRKRNKSPGQPCISTDDSVVTTRLRRSTPDPASNHQSGTKGQPVRSGGYRKGMRRMLATDSRTVAVEPSLPSAQLGHAEDARLTVLLASRKGKLSGKGDHVKRVVLSPGAVNPAVEGGVTYGRAGGRSVAGWQERYHLRRETRWITPGTVTIVRGFTVR